MLLNWIIAASQVDFTTEQLALIINAGVFLLLLLAFLGGFWRGLFKSTFNIIATCGSVLLFFLVFPLISKALMRTDFSFLNLSLDNGIYLTTPEETISNILVNVLSVSVPEGMLLTETFIYQAIYSVVEMAIRLALLIVLLVLNLTLFKFIYWVIYFIVKPRPRDEFNQRIKLTKQNRLYGGLVGLFNFILILLVICVPLAGVFSIAEAANEIAQVAPEENDNERLLVTYDGVQMNLSTNNRELLVKFGIDELYIDFIEEMAPLYRKTIPGFIYSIPIGGTEIDSLIFDELFKVKYEDEKLKIRKEIVTVMEVVKMISERTNLNVDFNSLEGIALILDELTEKEINEIFDKLSTLDIVQFAIPLAADTLSLMIKYGDETMTAYIDFVELVEVLKEQDYHKFISNIGGVVGSVKGFLDASSVTVNELANGTIDYNKFLKCDKAAVNNVLENIADLELIDNLVSAALSKVTDLEEVKESLMSFMVLDPKVEISENNKYVINGKESKVDVLTEELDNLSFKIDFESGNFVIVYDEEEYETSVSAEGCYYPISFDEVSFSYELRNIGKIYEAFDLLGIRSIESIMKLFDDSIQTEEEIDFSKFTFENLNNLSKAILSSKIISSSTENLFVFVNNLLPNEYHNMIVIPESLNPEDLTSALIVGRVVLKENLLSGNLENIDYKAIIANNKDEFIDAIKKSNIIMSNLTPVLKMVLGMTIGEDIIVIPDDVVWGDELGNLLDGVAEILNSDILGDEFDIKKINVEALASSLSNSEVLTGSLNNIITYVIGLIEIEDFEITVPSDIVWDYNEIYSLLKAFSIVGSLYFDSVNEENGELDVNVLLQGICELTDEDIKLIIGNKLISRTVSALLYNLSNTEGGALNGVIEVNIPLDDEDTWFGNGERKGELEILLSAAKHLIKDLDIADEENLVNNILNNVSSLTDSQIDEISSSIILSDTVRMYVESINEEEVVLVIPEDIDWDTEINKILKAFKVIINKVEIDFSNFDPNTLLDSVLEFGDEEVDLLFASRILCATVEKYLIDFDEEGVIVYQDVTDLSAEFKALLKAVKLVFGSDFSFANMEFDVNEILANITSLENNFGSSDDQIGIILESKILVDTIVMYIENINEGEDILVIPDGVVWVDTNEPGELRNILLAVKVLFDGKEIDFEQIDANIIMDLDDDDIDNVLKSVVIEATIKDIIESLDSDSLVVNPIDDLGKELKALIKAVKLVLGEDVDLNNLTDIDVNEVLSNVVKLTNDINATNEEDDEVGQILESNILTDTIVMYIEDFASGDDSVIKLPEDDFSWKDEGNNPGEIRSLLESLKVLFGEEVDLENIDANIIMDLSDSDVDTVLNSKILYATIKDIIESLDGDVLVVNPIDDLSEELKALIKAVKLVLGEDIDLADMGEIDANEVLNNIVNLTNDINATNEEDDEVGQILESNILTDTIITFIEDFAYQDGSVIVMPEDDFSWKDEGNNPGEIRSLLKSLSILFGDEIDLDSLDINIIMDLSDDEIDTVLESIILKGTIKNIIESLDGDALVVNPIEDVNKELKALIKAVKLVLGEDGDINDFGSMDTNTLLSNIVGLTNDINAVNEEDDEVGQLLESNIICDTIEMFVMKLADEGTIIVPGEEDLQWRDYKLAGVKVPGELRNLLNALKVLFGEEEVDMNFDANIIMDLSDDDIDTVLESDILYLTIKDIIESLDGTLVVNPIVNLNRELKALIRSIKIILGEDADLANPEFEVDRILEISDEDMETMLESNIVYDTFYEMIIDLTEGSLEGILVLKPGTDLDKDEMIKFVNSIKVVLDGGNLSTMESSSFNIDKFIDLTDDEIDTLLDSTLISYSAALQVDTVLYGDEAALGEFIIFESYYDSDRIEEIESDLGNIIRVIRDLKALGINYESFTFEEFENALTGPDSEGKDEMLADALVQSKIITNSLNNMMNIIFSEGIYAAFPDADVEVGEVVPVGSETLEDAWRREIIQLVAIIDKLQLVENTDITDETPVGDSTVGIENARNIGIFLDACSDSQLLEPVIIGILDAYVTCYVDFVDGDTINAMVQEEGSYEVALAGAAKLIQMFME